MEVRTAQTLSTARDFLSVTDSSEDITAADERVRMLSDSYPVGADTPLAVNDSLSVATKLRVLLVEDNPADTELALDVLAKDGFVVASDVVQSAEQFRERIRAASYDVVLADYNLPQWNGIEALEILHQENQNVPLIVLTGYLGEERAVECLKQGATDCVLKDRICRLPHSVRRALTEQRLRNERGMSEKKLTCKAAELARSNAELEQFAYVASHDLQEPLRMVANYTQLLGERYRGKLDEQADKYIAYAVDGAVRMQALIQDLLKFSQVGKQTGESQTAHCRIIVDRALENLQTAIQESGAVVKYSTAFCKDACDWNGLPVVMADPSELMQVFQNLIGNAIKFHGPEAPAIQIDAEIKGHEWVFAISDNGIGIPQENWQDIFVIFRRLHTRTEYAGNGIGLSICKKIIERHGGKIWIERQVKPGCLFKFTLPAETHLVQKEQP
jgi:signal transduction histidine kinase